MMKKTCFLFIFVKLALGGPNDTVNQLRVAFTNVPFTDQTYAADVTVKEGEVPDWLSGSLARHACLEKLELNPTC